MPEPEPVYFVASKRTQRLLAKLAGYGYRDTGYQWAGQKHGHVHLFENEAGRVLRLNGDKLEVWRE